jgi:hypothetical protein
VDGGDVVDVESRGEGGLGSRRRSLMDDRSRSEDKTLHSGHLGGQSDDHGTLLLQGEGHDMLMLLRRSQGDLDGDDGRDQRGVGGGLWGSIGGVCNEWASGGEDGAGAERSEPA